MFRGSLSLTLTNAGTGRAWFAGGTKVATLQALCRLAHGDVLKGLQASYFARQLPLLCFVRHPAGTPHTAKHREGRVSGPAGAASKPVLMVCPASGFDTAHTAHAGARAREWSLPCRHAAGATFHEHGCPGGLELLCSPWLSFCSDRALKHRDPGHASHLRRAGMLVGLAPLGFELQGLPLLELNRGPAGCCPVLHGDADKLPGSLRGPPIQVLHASGQKQVSATPNGAAIIPPCAKLQQRS